jgi:hypothetical protein
MPVVKQYPKDPAAKLDYLMDWSSWLPSGDTISTSAWAIDPPVPDTSLAIAGSPAPSNTTTTATCWLTGGTLGQKYILRNRITTVGGRTEDRSVAIVVEDR